MQDAPPATPFAEGPEEALQDGAPIIRLEGVAKNFGRLQALAPTTLSVQRGEFFALLGPSGCGKTTLLRLLSGFHAPSAGRIFIDRQDVTPLPPDKRPVNMVFQSYAVFPHMSVGQNVAYGLKLRRVRAPERRRLAEEALALVRLEGLHDRRPAQLSGGQRQRVALARALVLRPKVLLLDEPLSALDAKLREHMQAELVRLQKQVGITFVIVTHDQNEALSMADRIAVMNEGRLEQMASPEELYRAPASRFVAGFIGRINFFPALLAADGSFSVESPLGSFVPSGRALEAARSAGPGRALTAALRPEQLRLSPAAPSDEAGRKACSGVIAELAYYGDYCNVAVDLEGIGRVTSFVINNTAEAAAVSGPGQRVWCSWAQDDIFLIPEPHEEGDG